MQITVRLQRPPRAPERSNKLFPGEPAAHPEDMGGLDQGIELDVISVAAPEVTHVGEEIVHLVNLGVHQAKFC
jgi:hypothetical protein